MNKKLIISIILTLFYAVITFYAVVQHEVWADEVQVWQLCRHLSLFDLFAQLHNEGHPALFYILVYPFAKFTADIFYMQLFCWLSMCCAVFVLLYKSPFNGFAKFSIVTSAGFLYFLPVMARNYAIIPVLVFLAAILYSKQKELPVFYAVIIALIANTHAFMFAFAFVLAGFFIYDNVYIPLKQKLEINIKKYITASVIMLFGIFSVILQLYDSSSSNNFLHIKTEKLFECIVNVFLNFFIKAYDSNMLVTEASSYVVIGIIAVIFIACFIILLIKDKRMFLLSFLAIGFQFLIYFFIYEMIFVTRIFLAFLVLIFCFWVLLEKTEKNKFNKAVNIILGLLFLFTANNGLAAYSDDVNMNYSSSEDTAEYIMRNIDKKDIILVEVESSMIPVAYYLEDNKIISAVREIPLKYAIWDDKCVKIMDNSEWEKTAKHYSELYPDSDIYVLRNVTKLYDSTLNDSFEKVYLSPECIDMYERYVLYKYKKEN